MPLLGALGAAGSRAFGIFRKLGNSVTFNTEGYHYWTAPAGVTSVNLSLRGGSGTSGLGWLSMPDAYAALTGGPYTYDTNTAGKTFVGSTLTYETVKSAADSLLSTYWSGVTTNTNGAFYSNQVSRNYHYISGNWYYDTTSYAYTYRRTATATRGGYINSYSGTVSSGSSFSLNSWAENIEVYTNVDNYGGSTYFNWTQVANGSNTSNPTLQTFSNVAVTPGTQYTILVGTNYTTPTSFVTISWG